LWLGLSEIVQHFHLTRSRLWKAGLKVGGNLRG
jgi:hypothetical protein